MQAHTLNANCCIKAEYDINVAQFKSEIYPCNDNRANKDIKI